MDTPEFPHPWKKEEQKNTEAVDTTVGQWWLPRFVVSSTVRGAFMSSEASCFLASSSTF